MTVNVKTQAYQDVSSLDKDQVVKNYLPLVRKIAHHLKATLPDTVLIEDLYQAGIVGLLEAFSRFDVGKKVAFASFASLRIKGAMIDELRAGEWVPRSVSKNARLIQKAIHDLSQIKQSEVTEQDIAEHLSMSLSQVQSCMNDMVSSKLLSLSNYFQSDDQDDVSLEQVIPDEQTPSPEGLVFDLRENQQLAEVIKVLPEKEQLVLSLYYFDELNFKEIAEVLNLSESRISQLHSQIIFKLHTKMASC